MEIQVRFRGNLLDVISDPAKAARVQELRSITTLDPTQSQRDNNMYLFCLMVKSYPDRYSYEGFNDFFAVLTNPIPRSLWPDKPVLNGAQDIDHQSSFVLSFMPCFTVHSYCTSTAFYIMQKRRTRFPSRSLAWHYSSSSGDTAHYLH
jgi:hypothetical protein